MIFLNFLLFALLIVKVGWVIVLGSLLLLQHDILLHDKDLVKRIETIELILHLTLTSLIGILLIYLFHHLTPARVCIEGYEKLYLYTFGILTAIGSVKKFVYTFVHTTDMIGK
jgi:hypothetical protein